MYDLSCRKVKFKESLYCFSCKTPFYDESIQSPTSPTVSQNMTLSILKKQNNLKMSKKFGCELCGFLFCYDCDYFIHESLHNCPGCF